MKVSRRHGAVRLRFDQLEAPLLVSLLDDFAARLQDGAGQRADPVEQRLFPAAYQQDQDAADYRDLTESTLRDERGARAMACRAELSTDADVGTAKLSLTAEDGQRWIQVLNDLRLVVGTKLGITEDDGPDIDPDDPEVGARTVYYWLTYVQESMVQALMRL